MSETTTFHATLILERMIPATDHVFTAYADINERKKRGAPSDNTTMIYDNADFPEGGEMPFDAAPKQTPISTERPATSMWYSAAESYRAKRSLWRVDASAPLSPPWNSNPDGDHTKLKSTVQLASFVGQDMVRGRENGTNASLDNLVNFFSNQKTVNGTTQEESPVRAEMGRPTDSP